MRKTAALSVALALGMTLGGSVHAQGEADVTPMKDYTRTGTTDSTTAGSTTGTVGQYDANTNSNLGTGIMGYHGSRMFGNGANNGGNGTGMFGHGGFMGTTWGDGDHTNNFGTLGNNNGTNNGSTGSSATSGTTGTTGTGTFGTYGTDTDNSYTATATDDDGMDWGWLGLLGLLGLAGLRSRNETRTRI